MIQVRIWMEGVPAVRFDVDDKRHPDAGFGIIAAVAALMRPDACPVREALYAATPVEPDQTKP